MKLVRVAATAILLSSVAPTMAAPAAGIFQKGRRVSGTCFATFKGVVLMNGRCLGLGHGRSVFVTSEKDGCSLEITPSGDVLISAYRNECGNSDLGDLGEPIGKLKRVGRCLVGSSARVCLEAGRGFVKNAY